MVTNILANYLTKAQDARQMQNWADAEKYYSLVRDIDPQCIEALFYSSYSRVYLSLSEYIIANERQKRFDELNESLNLIAHWYDKKDSTLLRPLIKAMSKDIILLSSQHYIYYQVNPYENINSTGQMLTILEMNFIRLLEKILKKDEQAYLYKLLRLHYERCIDSIWLPNYTKALLLKNLEAIKR